MKRQDCYEKLVLGSALNEFAEFLRARLVELEPMKELRADQFTEREHLRLTYQQIEEERKYFGAIKTSPLVRSAEESA